MNLIQSIQNKDVQKSAFPTGPKDLVQNESEAQLESFSEVLGQVSHSEPENSKREKETEIPAQEELSASLGVLQSPVLKSAPHEMVPSTETKGDSTSQVQAKVVSLQDQASIESGKDSQQVLPDFYRSGSGTPWTSQWVMGSSHRQEQLQTKEQQQKQKMDQSPEKISTNMVGLSALADQLDQASKQISSLSEGTGKNLKNRSVSSTSNGSVDRLNSSGIEDLNLNDLTSLEKSLGELDQKRVPIQKNSMTSLAGGSQKQQEMETIKTQNWSTQLSTQDFLNLQNPQVSLDKSVVLAAKQLKPSKSLVKEDGGVLSSSAALQSLGMREGGARTLQDLQSMQTAKGKEAQRVEIDGAESFEKLAGVISMRVLKNGSQEMNLRLSPEHLGDLKIRVSTKGDKVSLAVEASDQSAKSVLESSLQSLKDQLASQNLSLASVEIVTGKSNSALVSTQSFMDMQGQSQWTQQQSMMGQGQSFANQGRERESQSESRSAQESLSRGSISNRSTQARPTGRVGREGTSSIDLIA